MINKYTTTVENIDKLRENKENKRQNIDVNYFLFQYKMSYYYYDFILL